MIAAMTRRRLDFLKALLIAFLAAAASEASPNPRKLDESTPGGAVKCGTCVQSPPPPALVYPPPPPKSNYRPPPSEPSAYNPPPYQPSAYNPPPYQPSANIPGPPGGNLYPVGPFVSGARRSVASGLAPAIFKYTAWLAALVMSLALFAAVICSTVDEMCIQYSIAFAFLNLGNY